MQDIVELFGYIQEDQMEYFDEFYELTKRKVFNLIYSYLQNYDESEDILQDTYLKFLRYKNKIKKDGNVMSYILEIAKSLSLNYLKKNKRFVKFDEELEIEDKKEVKKDLSESKINDIMKAVLKPHEYQIVILHVVEGMTHKEISELLNKPLGTITWAYNNAIEKVRRYRP